MNLATQLDLLQTRLSEALRYLPGATALYQFGSGATSYSDVYSDIDLQVVSANMAASCAVWPGILERVGAIEFAWPITPAPDNTAFSILFHGESYYHKVDIALSDPVEAEQFFVFNPDRRQLWRQEPNFSETPPPTSAYIPAPDTIGHTLIEELLGSVRYVKARKRGHHLTCWRFIRSKPDTLLYLRYKRNHGWPIQKQNLTTWDYKELDIRLGEPERTALMGWLDWSTPTTMDLNFYRLTTQVIHLLQEQAQIQDEVIPVGLPERYLSFIQAELGLE